MLKLYLAGPTVFLPDARERGEALKAACREVGCEGLFPLDFDMGAAPDARRIMSACLAMLDKAQAAIADLSPFRGPHVDGGTAFELGYAAARGIPIFGYASDTRPLSARVPARSEGEHVDANGIAIEQLGQACNAMIAGALAQPVFATPFDAIEAACKYLNLCS